MARMIPPFIDPKNPSPGEIEAFARLRDDPGTDGWIVLHSYDLPQHPTRVSGEADFVILVPGLGMLVLEIKAHRRVSRDADGQWRLGNDPPTRRSPFNQASDASYALLENVIKRRRKDLYDSLVGWHAVLFTHTPFEVPAMEWNSWEALDRNDFTRQPISALVTGVLEKARERLPKAQEGRPSAEECEAVARLLRPEFEVVQPAAERRGEREQELRAYTEEQYVALDGFARHPRVVFEGPAGTGKTLLALEAARRAGASGKSVGLLCFNRHLGAWIERQTMALPGVTSRTLHQQMLRETQAKVPAVGQAAFFEDVLPDLAIEAVLDRDAPAQFDVLIVDEAQDIMRESYLDYLDVTLKGGLGAGTWTMFGDFERQAVYEAASLSVDEFSRRSPGTPVFSLRTNCRNTPRIARWVSMISALEPGYTRVRRPEGGPRPRTQYYDSEEEQLAKLTKVLSDVYGRGFEGSDIAILSFGRDGAAARLAVTPWRDRIKPFELTMSPGHIGYATVQAFKGLEAPVIIVTDVDAVQGERAHSLFYTATTRATEELHIIADTTVAPDVLDLTDRYNAEETSD